MGSGTTTPEIATAPEIVTVPEIVGTTTAPPAVQNQVEVEERQTPLTIAELNAPDGNAPIEINTVYKAILTSRDHVLTHHYRMRMIASIQIPRLGLTLDRIQRH